MKTFVKEFFKRGLIAFGFGPFVMAIVYICLSFSGIEDTLSLGEIAKQVLLVSLMAFIAGGMTAIYFVERLALPIAIAIHAVVLYLDYILIYLVNGWLNNSIVPIIVFSVMFALGFALIWGIVYIVTKNSTKRMNEKLKR